MAGGYLDINEFPSVASMSLDTQEFVNDLLTDSRSRAAEAVAEARDAIADLKGALPPEDLPDPPKPPTITTSFNATIGTGFGEDPDLGEIIVNEPQPFTLDDLDIGAEIDALMNQIGTYSPIVTGINLPPTPTAWSGSLPLEPVLVEPTDPGDVPSADYGAIGTLLELNIPDFEDVDLEVFSDPVPTFTATVPSGAVDWAEPSYNAWIADQLKTVLTVMLAGGTGIAPTVEREIWDRDRSRLDTVAREALENAADDFAAKGFALPGAALIAKTLIARALNQVEVSKASRDVAIKQADLEQANRQFAIKTGAELEKIFADIFMQVTDRSFQIAKFSVEAEISIFNARVAAFNVEREIFGAQIERWKAAVEYAKARIEIYRSRLEAEAVKGSINKSIVDVFSAKISAFVARIEAFRAKVQAVVAKTEIEKSKVEIYRGQIAGVQATVDAKKAEFDAFEARVRGESSKVGLEESNSRVYSARVGAISSIAEISVKDADAKIGKQKLLLEAHLGELKRLGDYADLQLRAIQSRAATYEATTRRDSAKFEFDKEAKTLEIQSTIETGRTLISYYAAQLEVWKARVQHLIENSKIIAGSMQAAGQIAGTLAAGAYAGTSVSAAFGGSVSRSEGITQSATTTKSDQTQTQTSFEERHNYEHDV